MAFNRDNGRFGCWVMFLLAGVFMYFVNKNAAEEGQTETKGFVSSTINETEEIDPLVKKYEDNRLETGYQPYYNETTIQGTNSRIIVKTSGTDQTDVVVILKRNGLIARNQYVRAGDEVFFNIPDGTYQIFFYYGKGWYPNKEMPNGMKGGFVTSESFSKDDPQSLENNILTYELILQTNGNFSARPSNAEEAF